MNSLNSILIEGNVVRDPVMRETPRGSLVCTFSLASNRFYRQDEETEQETSFFEVETWSKLAEVCSKNCGKGRGIRVVGRLKQDRWTGSDGKNYSKIKVVAEHVEFKPQFKNAQDSSGKDAAPADSENESLAQLAADAASLAESIVSEEEALAVF